MPSMTYICKSCGAVVKYPAKQDQDHQPLVKIGQSAVGVVIQITKTAWEFDPKGRPFQVLDDKVETIEHRCFPPGN